MSRNVFNQFGRAALITGISGIAASRAIAQAGVTRRLETTSPPTLVQAPGPPERRYGSPLLISGQIVVGTLAAAGAGLMSWAAYDHPYGPDRRVKGDEGYTPNANTAYAVGSFAGAVVATHLIGRLDGSKGNLLGTIVGAAIPSIPLFFGRHEPYLPLIGIVLVAPAQAIGATLGEQLSRP
jgi:hypothetical protein